MRFIKMFGLASAAAVAATAFVGATSASAVSTQLCDKHVGLNCEAGHAVNTVHLVLAAGTVWELLATISVLCLGHLIEATAGALAAPQAFMAVAKTFTGCGTGSTHNNCTVTIPVGGLPTFDLLKEGLDAGTLTTTKGAARVVCSNLGLNCILDLEGMEYAVGGGHFTADEAFVEELGGKFLCPDEGLVDALLKALTNTYVLG